MARTPASDGSAGVGKSGSPAPRSITSSPAALRRFASCEIAVAAAPPDRPVHAVTGLARTGRVLKERPVEILAGAAKDLAALLERAALKLAAVAGVVLAWPEALVDGDGAAAVDTVLGEARDAHRIVLSWNPTLLGDFLERHARRALVLGTAPVDEPGRPLPPVGRARFAVVPPLRRPVAVREALDVLSATTPFVWSGGPIAPSEALPDAVLSTALPSREELAALA